MTTPFAASPFDDWLAGDPEVARLLGEEAERQSTTLQLIASENFTSPAVLAASGSVLTNKYAEGYPGRRYYGGNQVIDEVEDLARRRPMRPVRGRARQRPAPRRGQRQPGRLPGPAGAGRHHPGHAPRPRRPPDPRLAGQHHLQDLALRLLRGVGRPPTTRTSPGEIIDFDQVADVARRERPALIVAGSTAYARIIDPLPFREIADSVGARFMFDAAHPAGLIAGGVHPSPVGVADVVTFTTHKTLRGPRGGAILYQRRAGQGGGQRGLPRPPGRPPRARHRGQGGGLRRGGPARVPHLRRPGGGQRRRPGPARWPTRASAWSSGGTENHQVLVDLRTFDAELTGKVAQEALDRAGITCNRNTIPDDPRSPFVTSGLRLGSAAQTTAGMGPAELRPIGGLIGRTLRHRDDEAAWTPSGPRSASCAPASPRTRPWAGRDPTGPGAR